MYARIVRPFDDAKILWAVTEDAALGGKPVGALVVGLNLSKLEKTAQK